MARRREIVAYTHHSGIDNRPLPAYMQPRVVDATPLTVAPFIWQIRGADNSPLVSVQTLNDVHEYIDSQFRSAPRGAYSYCLNERYVGSRVRP